MQREIVEYDESGSLSMGSLELGSHFVILTQNVILSLNATSYNLSRISHGKNELK